MHQRLSTGKNAFGRRVLRWAAISVGLVLAVAIGLAVDIVRFSMATDLGKADAALVLGAAVVGDRPSPVYEERIRHAVALYAIGRVPLLVFTGGLGAGDSLSEGEVGRDWAVAHGVPTEAIRVETQSKTTIQNFAFAAPLLADAGAKRVLVVSDPLHMRRALLIAQSLGIDAFPAPTPTTRYQSLASQVPFLLRELYFTARFVLLRTD